MKSEQDLLADLDNIFAALALIEIAGERSGTIPCPACDGSLAYSVAANGHVRGRCQTPACLEWIQ